MAITYFPCLTALSSIFIKKLNSTDHSSHTSLVPDFSKNASNMSYVCLRYISFQIVCILQVKANVCVCVCVQALVSQKVLKNN